MPDIGTPQAFSAWIPNCSRICTRTRSLPRRSSSARIARTRARTSAAAVRVGWAAMGGESSRAPRAACENARPACRGAGVGSDSRCEGPASGSAPIRSIDFAPMKILIPIASVFVALLGLAAARSPAVQQAANPFQPGAEHALLQKLAGTWDAVLVTRGPDGKEIRTPGRQTTAALAPFHVTERYEGELMGQKFSGSGLNGYCTVRKQYFTYWIDTMTSSPLTAYGSYDAAKGELALVGECIGTSGKLEPCRVVTKFVDDDHRAFELYAKGPDGKEALRLHIDYTRAR
ncbi:MAG: DUF1579 domain-containing protein [Planctomycetota bacterium]|nr:MAG: DUF1579 domain-containing protein [Planctomycetota bacterium]